MDIFSPPSLTLLAQIFILVLTSHWPEAPKPIWALYTLWIGSAVIKFQTSVAINRKCGGFFALGHIPQATFLLAGCRHLQDQTLTTWCIVIVLFLIFCTFLSSLIFHNIQTAGTYNTKLQELNISWLIERLHMKFQTAGTYKTKL